MWILSFSTGKAIRDQDMRLWRYITLSYLVDRPGVRVPRVVL